MRGEPNARIIDFRRFLVGTDDEPGLLYQLDLPFAKKDFSEETLRLYALRLGFSHEETGYGCFSDEHESELNKADRDTRFLPQYKHYFDRGICEFEFKGHTLPVDTRLVDEHGEDLIAGRETFYDITDARGLKMRVDMGGIVPQRDEPIYLLASHDESCFAAGDFESKVPCCLCLHAVTNMLFGRRGFTEATRTLIALLLQAWQHKDAPKKQCKSKSTGPKRHYASFSVEWGNGCICLRPDLPRPKAISLKHLRNWHARFKAGSPFPLPDNADVVMRPGKNYEMWWCSEEFWMQCDLAIAIFEYVFPDRPNQPHFRLVACLDWSQGHAAMSPDGLDAENMLVNPGGVSCTHIRATTTPLPRMETHVVGAGRRRVPVFSGAAKPWPDRAPLCISCMESSAADRALCREAYAGHEDDANFQTIGKKGLKQVLQERNIDTKGMNQEKLVDALQKFPDFTKRDSIERAHVTEIFKSNGHVALFGVKYHADLAHVERFWMHLKQQIRPHLTGKYSDLVTLIDAAYCKYTVSQVRRDARHCRELMLAYSEIANAAAQQLDLANLTSLAKEYKSHRCATMLT